MDFRRSISSLGGCDLLVQEGGGGKERMSKEARWSVVVFAVMVALTILAVVTLLKLDEYRRYLGEWWDTCAALLLAFIIVAAWGIGQVWQHIFFRPKGEEKTSKGTLQSVLLDTPAYQRLGRGPSRLRQTLNSLRAKRSRLGV